MTSTHQSGNERLGAQLAAPFERAEVLDAPGKAVAKRVRTTFGPGALKDALSGTWLGHALHPLLTDVVIGSFVSANVLDLLGGDDDGRAAERLIGIGILAYPPTALTGATDWSDSEPADPRIRRVGVAHAAVNATALGLYGASLAARRRGSRGRGKVLGLAGLGALGLGGYLGSHMAYVQGVGANQTIFDEGPADWTDAAAADDVRTGEPHRAVVGDTPVLILRHPHGLHAIHDRCSHRGCSLAEGKVDGEVVECTCHGSRFRLSDGGLERGPATTPQPAFEARESDGRVELRLRSGG
jgi:nitrite reductase/ring-hydroxylating ferredoxin subunit/uncharacterized membrane protein